MQLPIHIFLETSAMPRYLLRPGHAYERLVDLANANLVKLHASAVTLDEWNSQMVATQKDGLQELYKGLRTFMRQDLSQKVKHLRQLQKIETIRDDIERQVNKLTSNECENLLTRLGLEKVPIGGTDADFVFKNYFAGHPPFSSIKHRNDIPDAFILAGARSLAAQLAPHRFAIAVCHDARLRDALAQIEGWKAVKDVTELMETEELKEATTHLAIFNSWTLRKEKQIVEYLKSNPLAVTEAITEYAMKELQFSEFSDFLIPVDNNEATIDCIDDVHDVQIEWDEMDVFGPGWIYVPFSVECDAQLSMRVYRADAFGMPDWIDVDIGDFESDYYFDATGNRKIKASGSLSLQFTKEDLEQKAASGPSGIEVNDIDISIVPDRNECEY